MDKAYIQKLVALALREDATGQDITSRLAVPPGAVARATIISREPGVLAGLPLARGAFRQVDRGLRIKALARDGASVRANGKVLVVTGAARSIMTAERTAINFLGQLSGIASLTRQYVRRAGGMKVYDTRKTHAGLRVAEKYAVRLGGGYNHRFSLKEAAMVKDNHRKFAADLGSMVRELKTKLRKLKGSPKLNVEVENLGDALLAAASGADLLMMDNMTPGAVRKIVKALKGAVPLEVTGGVNLANIAKYAASGADRVSIGRLTHSAPALDFSLELAAS